MWFGFSLESCSWEIYSNIPGLVGRLIRNTDCAKTETFLFSFLHGWNLLLPVYNSVFFKHIKILYPEFPIQSQGNYNRSVCMRKHCITAWFHHLLSDGTTLTGKSWRIKDFMAVFLFTMYTHVHPHNWAHAQLLKEECY